MGGIGSRLQFAYKNMGRQVVIAIAFRRQRHVALLYAVGALQRQL